jgi:hypothetical protein
MPMLSRIMPYILKAQKMPLKHQSGPELYHLLPWANFPAAAFNAAAMIRDTKEQTEQSTLLVLK